MDGETESLDSSRAELEAISSLVYFIRVFRRTKGPNWAPHSLTLTLWVDNEQALIRAGAIAATAETGNALEPEYDIVRDIHFNCT